jgi:hypothetical protein
VLSGAYSLAEAGKKLTEGLMLFGDLKVSSKGIETSNFYTKLLQNRETLSQSLDLLRKSQADFERAEGLPPEYESSLAEAKQQVSQMIAVLENLVAMEDLYLTFIGNSPKTYLVVFQNYDELRATGGFIGTYGVAKMKDGAIDKLKIESVYNLDGNIFDKVAAPGPFQPEIKKWGMRDANWFVDFRQSARKLLYFFEKGGQTADGVIALTPDLFKDLLGLVGPIRMDSYGVVLTKDNFQEVVQHKTSFDYDKELNQPKKFLADFAPKLLDRLHGLNQEQWLMLLEIMEDSLAKKSLMVYSAYSDAQSKIEKLGYGGAIKDTEKDYLAVFSSNLGGTKTDLEMHQTMKLKTKILSDGSLINTLTVRRENKSAASNKSYLRILVPHGSSLVAASGFDIGRHERSSAENHRQDSDLALWDEGELRFDQVFVRTEAGKTEFGGWVEVAAGDAQEMVLVYSLPFKLESKLFGSTQNYSLLFQRQPGSQNLNFESELDLGSFRSRWQTGDIAIEGNKASLKYTSSADQYWGIVLSR